MTGVRSWPSARSGARRRSGLASSGTRFAARAQAVRRRPWLIAAWALVALTLAAGGVWLVFFSSVLAARQVWVEGVPRGAVADITRRAAVPIGAPLARVDTAAIAARVIESATLAEVTVSRSYPGTIVITASPRVPVLAVKTPQGEVQVVDAHGVAYATVTTVPRGVPLIATTQQPPTKDALRAGITVMQALLPAQRLAVGNVSVSGANLVTFRLGKVTVRWGGSADPALKVKVLTSLLNQKGVQTIDVSAPRTPVTI